MATPQELQAIIREMNAGLRNLVREQQTFLQNIATQTKGNDVVGKRRGDPTSVSPTKNMEANRRLTGSVINLNKQITTTYKLMDTFARTIRIATRQISRKQGGLGGGGVLNGSNTTNPSNNSNALAAQIHQLVQQLRSNNNQPPGGRGTDARRGTGGARGDSPSQIKQWMSSFADRVLGKLTIAAGLEQGYKEVKLAASKNATYNPLSTDAPMMGMSSEELINMQAQNRTSLLRATNGIDQWTKTVRDSQQGLLPYTGSMKDAAAVTANLQTNLLDLGFSFDQANDIIGQGKNGLVSQLKNLSSVTGETVLQITDRIKNLNTSDESKDLMRKMDRKQRVEYVETQGKLLNQYTLLTGSISRAEEIVREQMNAGKLKATDRLVGSVKTRAAAINLGMDQGKANRLQQLMSMNPAKLMQNKELSMELQRLGGEFKQLYSTAKGSSNFPTEHLADVLGELGNVEQFKSQDTSLDTRLNPNNVTEQQQKSVSNTLDQNKILNESLMWLQRISDGITKSAIIMIGIGAAMVGLRAIGGVGNLTKILKGGGSAAGTTSGATGGAGVLAKSLLSNPRVLAGIASLGTVATGIAVDKLWDPTSQKQEQYKNTTSSSLEYAGYGMAVGSVIAPVIGTAIGGALGGLAGSIIGFNKDTREQGIFDSEKEKNRSASDIKLMQFRHDKETSMIKQKMDAEQQLYNTTTGNERNEHELKLNMLNKQMDRENELFNVKMNTALELQNVSGELASKLQQKYEIQSGIKTAFSKTGRAAVDKFDTQSYLETSKQTPSDLLSTIAKNTDVSEQDYNTLQEQILGGKTVINSRLVGIIKQALTTETTDIDSQTQLLNQRLADAKLKKQQTTIGAIIPTDATSIAGISQATIGSTMVVGRKMDNFASNLLSENQDASKENTKKATKNATGDESKPDDYSPMIFEQLKMITDVLNKGNDLVVDTHSETMTQQGMQFNNQQFNTRLEKSYPTKIVDAFSSYIHN
jgi:hypothetical protein